ncbi:uncharacterized protein LOC117102068 [Anneissia japonica]|uniref:uncharacterized protein LOC117102068 n=1 Tax=Anneissia japonica TaxID=1529436 RepID=UPI00142591FA|nr:uncharacterized protein LOC117102068 [Anneissia japonica]
MYFASITVLLLFSYTYQASSKDDKSLIRSGPFNITINEGEDGQLTCILDDDPTVTKWMKNETVVKADDQHIVEYNSKTRIFTLEIKTVKRSDKGYYQCKIDTREQTFISDKAWLTVNEVTGEPHPSCEISKPIYNLCETVHMTCMTKNKSPPDTLKFLAIVLDSSRNGYYSDYGGTNRPLDSTSSSKPINTACHCSNGTHRWATAEFKADKPFNNSRIKCEMSNGSQCNKTLKIFPEVFITGPENISAYEGMDVVLTVTINTDVRLNILQTKWTRGEVDKEYIDETDNRYAMNNSQVQITLTINNLRHSDEGYYQCQVHIEEYGYLFSSYAWLTVNHHLECKTSKPAYEAGEIVEFTCTTDRKNPDNLKFKGKSHTSVYKSYNETYAWITSTFQAKKKDDGLTISCENTILPSETCSLILNISTLTNNNNNNDKAPEPVCQCQCHQTGLIVLIVLSIISIIILLFVCVKCESQQPGCLTKLKKMCLRSSRSIRSEHKVHFTNE